MSAPKSAYPLSVEELLPRARQLAAKLGEVPSRNRLKTELRIGAPKATALRHALQDGATEAEEPSPARLHVVRPDDPQPVSTEPVDTDTRAEADPSDSADPSASEPVLTPVEEDTSGSTAGQPLTQMPVDADPAPTPRVASGVDGGRRVRVWPVFVLALPAFVAIWSGWVGLGGLTGFGMVHPLPGIADGFAINTAITLPVGVETYAAYALRVWLSGRVPPRARRFAKRSAIASLALGALGQIAYHLMTAAGITTAPWPITTLVACLPVAVLGMGAALAHLLRSDEDSEVSR